MTNEDAAPASDAAKSKAYATPQLSGGGGLHDLTVTAYASPQLTRFGSLQDLTLQDPKSQTGNDTVIKDGGS